MWPCGRTGTRHQGDLCQLVQVDRLRDERGTAHTAPGGPHPPVGCTDGAIGRLRRRPHAHARGTAGPVDGEPAWTLQDPVGPGGVRAVRGVPGRAGLLFRSSGRGHAVPRPVADGVSDQQHEGGVRAGSGGWLGRTVSRTLTSRKAGRRIHRAKDGPLGAGHRTRPRATPSSTSTSPTCSWTRRRPRSRSAKPLRRCPSSRSGAPWPRRCVAAPERPRRRPRGDLHRSSIAVDAPGPAGRRQATR